MQTIIPTKIVGPLKIIGPEIDAEISVPLATYEKPLWPSVSRGAKISRLCGGIKTVVISECMTRSILFEAKNALIAAQIMQILENHAAQETFTNIVKQTSRFCAFKNLQQQIVGNLLYLRLSFTTGDAAGHNMTTKAADAIGKWIEEKYAPSLKYLAVSGNYCTDKKNSAVNGILGRGKYVVAEIMVPHEICEKHLRTSAAALVNLNIKKNLLGSILSGSVRSANAHFANMLLALYLATGQDAANIVEGAQGFTHAELREDGALYFSVTLPNIILGTVGSGKDLDFAWQNLALMGCDDKNAPIGNNSRRLAQIAAATVLCGELSLMAALTRPGELVACHEKIER